MDVRCGRCGTEYEFDDALVSERGTTVKCTNCGYQFKVHPSRATGAPERWVVRTASGRELVYTSLRDLQKGIAQRQVSPEDMLSRGAEPPRALGAIAELEPFFNTRGSPMRQQRTLAGVAPPAGMGGTVNMDGGALGTPLPPAAAEPPPRAPMATAPISLTTLHERAAAERAQLAGTLPLSEVDPPTVPRNARPTEGVVHPPPVRSAPRPPTPAAPSPPPPPMRAPLPAPTPPPPAAAAQMTPTPGELREAYRAETESLTEGRFPSAPPPSRRRAPRWILALVLLGAIALVAGTVGRKYIARFVVPDNQATRASDARVAEMLDKADRLLEDADLEGAREQLDKASALADSDPAVRTALARLETIRADLVWLKLRLLDPTDTLLVQATHRQLGQRVGRAKDAAESASKVAPNEPAVIRARIDALRLAGDLAQARALVSPIAQNQGTPENAYVLAALDLAEAAPGWAAIIERLRTAASADKDLERGRVALIYALARADKVSDAQTELGKLEARSATHPLLPELKAFLARFSASSDGAADAGEVATVDPASLPVLDTSQPAEPSEAPAGDFRQNLKQADAALKRGDLDRAQALYNAVLAKDPGNTEAIAGLGDVARLKKDPETAAKMYDKVLKDNPSYLPALMARADQKWDSGDKQGAATLYRRVLEQAGPSSSYGQRAAARIAQASESPAPSPPPATTSAPPSEPPEEAPAPKEEQPHIDTTDLPEFSK